MNHGLPFQPRNLSTPLTPLIGRERELSDLTGFLTRPDVRLITLTGAGGVGKTAVARRLVADVASRFPDGAAFVSLATVHDSDLVGVTLSNGLGLRDGGAAQTINLLREKHFLLVLDNFEQ